MRLIIAIISLASALWLSACSTTPRHESYAGKVIAADEDTLAHCKLLDELSSSSGLVGFFGPQGVENIKQNLLRQADAMGATHVAWGKPNVGYVSTSLAAKAYRCPAVQGQ